MTDMEQSDDDELSEETRATGRYIARLMRRGVIRKLLSGNDTGCFTTEQYKQAYMKETDRIFKCKWPIAVPQWQGDAAEVHLRSMSDMIREVSPGVWAAQ